MQIIGKKEFQQVYQSDYQLQLFTIPKIACQITSNQLTFLTENHPDIGFFMFEHAPAYILLCAIPKIKLNIEP